MPSKKRDSESSGFPIVGIGASAGGLLETILPRDQVLEDFEVAHDFPVIGMRKMLLNARRISGKVAQTKLILLAIEDITERKT